MTPVSGSNGTDTWDFVCEDCGHEWRDVSRGDEIETVLCPECDSESWSASAWIEAAP